MKTPRSFSRPIVARAPSRDPKRTRWFSALQTSGPTDGEPGPAEADAVYIRPNGMVTSDDGEVILLARKAVGDASDPWEKVVRIERWVARNMRNNFSTAFAPASEVARTLTGDCSEHAVLVAAMCRAVGIPSRAAIGMIYVNEERRRLKGFGFHMWPEVYVNQRWVAVDSSWDQTDVDATHIKLDRYQPRRYFALRGLPADSPRARQADNRPARDALSGEWVSG